MFVARLSGLPVFDPNGDQVGKVRDVVVALRLGNQPPRVLGLVVEVFGRRRISPADDPGHLGRHRSRGHHRAGQHAPVEQRPNEIRVLGELLDRTVTVRQDGGTATVFDAAIEQVRTGTGCCRRSQSPRAASGSWRRGHQKVLDWADAEGLTEIEEQQGATHILAAFGAMKPRTWPPYCTTWRRSGGARSPRRWTTPGWPTSSRSCPRRTRSTSSASSGRRAAAVLDEMAPDDAADLVAELPAELAESVLALMEPEEADDVRRLLTYADHTAGGLMTTEPVIPPDATVADALAQVRNADLTPALAAMVYVCRAPLETPTGRLIGVAHIQRLLREPPSELVSGVLDTDLDGLRADADLQAVSRYLATYNLVAALVVDENSRLLGAVTVDDVLDHLLPDDWREHDDPEVSVGGA